MKVVKICRNWQDENQTLGNCTVLNHDGKPIFSAFSLERGWRGNAKNVSCVPLGTYTIVLEYSPRFKKDLWELKKVPNRSECKFHASNYWYQLNGCIALGLGTKDINKDGYIDITHSRNAMRGFHKALKGETRATLIIQDNRYCQ